MDIKEIKALLSIEAVLRHYGDEVKGTAMRCPFHDDKSASMKVYFDTNVVRCFSGNCQHSGKTIDQIDYIMYREGLNKHEAILEAGRQAGLDGMEVETLKSHLNSSWVFLKAEILEGNYEPQAVRRVEIPKAKGGKRMLGIPTVTDRMLQQAIAQVLETIWEPKFHNNSYGFRPKRSAHQCVTAARTYLNEGKTYIVDIDLEKFFDRVNHDYLMHLLSREITDKRILSLIGKYLRTGILEDGIIQAQEEGTPQGSPLSPLLSNILLNELDWELTKRGLNFVRYADDFSIYLKSEKSAIRVLSGL